MTSLTKYTDRHNRLQILEYKKDGVNIGADKDLITAIYELHELLGASNALPEHDNPKQQTALRREYIEKWLRFVFIENDRAPAEIPIAFMLNEFGNRLVAGNQERKGNNIGAFAEAFNKSIPHIVERWERKHGKKEPPTSAHESEWKKICKNTALEKWPDEVLKQQHQAYITLFDGDSKLDELRKLTKGYFGRIERELQKREIL